MVTNHDTWHWQDPGSAWKGVGIYHVTLTIPSREPLLGELVIPDNNPAQAHILHSDMGNAVQGFWRAVKKIGRAYSYLRLSDGTIDENGHLSFFASAESRDNPLRMHFGEEEYRRLNPLFTEMPFIRPLSRKNQLKSMIRYVQMNPQRLATKRLMPGFFRVQEGIEIAGRSYRAVGNAELLQAARFKPVHVRRTMIDEAIHGDNSRLRDYMNDCVLAARQGAVMVSPFISDKEKEVMVVLLAEEHPIIYIADNGFRDYYKPSDGLFDAVAAGRVLILSPWEYDAQKRHVTRDECVAMNQMAEEICKNG